jgi:hypothetical protein
MKSLCALLVLGAISFYGLWPAYSGYAIKSAFDAEDPAALERKIDFPSVRASLRPAVSAEVEAAMSDLLKKAGPNGGALLEQGRAQALPQIVDAALAALVTPVTFIRIYSDGRSLKQDMEAIVRDKVSTPEGIGGVLGGIAGIDPAKTAETLGNLERIAQDTGIDTGRVLGGPLGKQEPGPVSDGTSVPAASQVAGGSAKPKYGLGNIKRVGFDGPLAITIGVARDQAAVDSDLTVRMGFVDGDWRLTGLVPRYRRPEIH